MGIFKRKKDERLAPCPACGTPIAAQALECEECGADLRELPRRPPEGDAHAPAVHG